MIAVTSLSITLTHPVKAEPLSYPDTKKGDVVDTYFGAKVADPYRWLEDDRSEATEKWVSKQNRFTYSYVDKLSQRAKIKSRLEELWSYKRYSAPIKKGKYYCIDEYEIFYAEIRFKIFILQVLMGQQNFSTRREYLSRFDVSHGLVSNFMP